MDIDTSGESRISRLAGQSFLRIEHAVYAGLGVLLTITAALGLGGAAGLLWEALREGNATAAMLAVIDRLLLVFMLVEILHTIGTSMQSHTLACEPFLVVALIASIRRVLVITLQSSEATRDAPWTAEHEALFRSTMIELAVLAMLIMVMVFSIYLLRRNRAGKA